MKYLIAVLFCASLHAQTAKVVQLTPSEAAQAKSLHEQQAEIEKKIDALEKAIVKAHLVEHAGPAHSPCAYEDGGYIAAGWGCVAKFEYSDDWKFIVPAPQKAGTFGSFANGCGVFTTTPAVSPSWIIPTSGTAVNLGAGSISW